MYMWHYFIWCEALNTSHGTAPTMLGQEITAEDAYGCGTWIQDEKPLFQQPHHFVELFLQQAELLQCLSPVLIRRVLGGNLHADGGAGWPGEALQRVGSPLAALLWLHLPHGLL